MTRRQRVIAALVAAVLLGATAGCAPSGAVDADPTVANAPPLITAPPTVNADDMAGRGGIVSKRSFDTSDTQLASVLGEANTAVYRSTSGVTGRPTDVSGTFFVPAGIPPEGGWPVLAWAHGTTGIMPGCGPSAAENLQGDASMVSAFLENGYAVALADYEGLGKQGAHPYLEPRTAAYNVIDSVRALRNLFPSAGNRWVAIGPSQGGQAAWAVNEFNPQYGTGLDLLGTVAMSPAVDVSGIAGLARSGSLTDSQFSMFPLVVVGISRFDPSIKVDHFLRGQAAVYQNELIGCGPDLLGARAAVTDKNDIGPASLRDENLLRDALRRIALPQAPLSVPMLVVNGLRDEMVPPEWVRTAIQRSCRRGGLIEHIEVPGAGHNDIGNVEAIPRWVANRFAGAPASSTCVGTP